MERTRRRLAWIVLCCLRCLLNTRASRSAPNDDTCTPAFYQRHVLLIGLEFVDPIFSGNGILTRSVVRGLLSFQQEKDTTSTNNDSTENGNQCTLFYHYKVTVICARPDDFKEDYYFHEDDTLGGYYRSGQLNIVPVPVPAGKWKKLDRNSAWEDMADQVIDILNTYNSSSSSFLDDVHVVLGVDWSSVPTYEALLHHKKVLLSNSSSPSSTTTKTPDFVYMAFRVFSRSRELHDDDSDDSSFYQSKERAAMEVARLTIPLSSVDKRELELLLPQHALQQVKFHVLNPPLRDDMLQLVRGDDTTSTLNRKYIMCNVRLSSEKNALQFARIMSRLSQTGFFREHDFVPLLVGTDCDASYTAEVKKLAPPETVFVDTFLQPHDLLDYMKQAVILLHPPVYEAYGMTIVEAASVATPALVHIDMIGASDLLSDAILQVDMNDHEVAAAFLEDWLEERKLPELRDIGNVAREHALSWTTEDYTKALHVQLEKLGTFFTASETEVIEWTQVD